MTDLSSLKFERLLKAIFRGHSNYGLTSKGLDSRNPTLPRGSV